MYATLCTPYTVIYMLHYVRYIIYATLCTLHYVSYTMYTLLHCVYCTTYTTLHTLHVRYATYTVCATPCVLSHVNSISPELFLVVTSFFSFLHHTSGGELWITASLYFTNILLYLYSWCRWQYILLFSPLFISYLLYMLQWWHHKVIPLAIMYYSKRVSGSSLGDKYSISSQHPVMRAPKISVGLLTGYSLLSTGGVKQVNHILFTENTESIYVAERKFFITFLLLRVQL